MNDITIENYTENVLRTCDLPNRTFVHAVLGISSEVGEVDETIAYHKQNLDEEKGDLCWYVALACHCLAIRFPILAQKSFEKILHSDAAHLHLLVMNQGDLADALKRHLFYGTELDVARVEATLIDVLHFCARGSSEALNRIINHNIMKLKVRFPGKFTQECAVNRDLEAEAKALNS
jgi:hypothetical protein